MPLTITVDGDLEQYLRTVAKNNGIAVCRYANNVLEKGIAAEKHTTATEALQDKYGGIWGEHPDYPREDWGTEAKNSDTRRGYWDWVANQIEIAAHQ